LKKQKTKSQIKKRQKKLIKNVEKENKELWFGIVDEEGDITYYKVTLLDIKGKNKEHTFKKSIGILLKNRDTGSMEPIRRPPKTSPNSLWIQILDLL
jgi:hypothetical protein